MRNFNTKHLEKNRQWNANYQKYQQLKKERRYRMFWKIVFTIVKNATIIIPIVEGIVKEIKKK